MECDVDRWAMIVCEFIDEDLVEGGELWVNISFHTINYMVYVNLYQKLRI